MIVCEKDFEQPDPKDAEHSLAEVDFYARILPNPSDPDWPRDHSLSMRKDLVTGLFEVYRTYIERAMTFKNCLVVDACNDSGETEVVFSGDFCGALTFADSEHNKYLDTVMKDEPCIHDRPGMGCLKD
jgi:hypothetical protein